MDQIMIQQYSNDILSNIRGDIIIVENIGLIAIGDAYDVEVLTGSRLYKITKK